MKIGAKVFDEEVFFKHFKDKVDFFEVMAIEERDYSFLEGSSKPIVIHSKHRNFGINNANNALHSRNVDSIRFSIQLANLCKSDKIIVHPGNISNSSCSIEEAISCIREINDKRILVENLPHILNCLCTTPKEMDDFLKKTGAGFCLDINHAISAALVLKKDPLEIIKDFIKLNPAHYHLGGQKIVGTNQTHLSFKDSEIDLKKIFELIPDDAEITLEVTTDIDKTEDDIETIKKLLR